MKTTLNMWIYISSCCLIKFPHTSFQEGVRHFNDHWDSAKEKTEMEDWHIYDHHDKAVPYDVFIKMGGSQKKESRICLAHAAG